MLALPLFISADSAMFVVSAKSDRISKKLLCERLDVVVSLSHLPPSSLSLSLSHCQPVKWNYLLCHLCYHLTLLESKKLAND